MKILALGAADLLVGCAGDRPKSVPPAVGPRPVVPPIRMVPDAPVPPQAAPSGGRLEPSGGLLEPSAGPWRSPAPLAVAPGQQQILFNAPGATRQVALTIDDGFNATAVAGYVDFASRAKIPLSFAPNGMYRNVWNQHAAAVRSLIKSGQVTMVNHTWSHRSIRTLSDATLRAEVERNDDWVRQTFGVTTRPWFRPPYGEHNERSRAILAELGYSRILMWSGSVGDSMMGVTAGELIAAARQAIQPGAVVLGHANQQVVVNLYGELERLIIQRALVPVTVETMFMADLIAR
ncbi:polysaccharide deacetylase family protein [Frankia sp. Cas3]|uniref:polysaccharide deacetylase family protein n=1 Tax=Frankia sp. Cas3 TaxID=3073926 RepID=UPI002AD250AF|nr:polysaccharide deacetylase family protein [Frankia sp. Cas3]